MILSFVIIIVMFFLTKPVHAATFSLIAPQNVVRGGNAQFTIEIDTEGETVTTSEIGIEHDSQYLQFVNATPGDAMTSIAVKPVDEKKSLLVGSNTAGFKGQGVFALVNFKVIATAPGTTQLCALWGPPTTPSGTPQPTSPPKPTTLPKAGSMSQTLNIAAVGFVSFAAASLILNRNFLYKNKRKRKNQKIETP